MYVSAIAMFVCSLGYGVIIPILPNLAARGGVPSALALSLVYSLYSASKIAAQIPGGVWVDRVGPRRALSFGLVFYVASLVACIAPFGASYLAGVRVVEGVATGIVFSAALARVALLSPPERAGRNLGVTVGIGSSGLLIGPLVGAGLGKPFGPAWPILIAALLGVVALVFVALDRHAGRVVPRAPRTLRRELADLLRASAQLAFLCMVLPVAFNKLTFSAYQGLLPLLGASLLGLDPMGIAGLFALIGVMFGAAQPLAGILVDRFEPRRLVSLLMLPLLGTLVLLAFAKTPWTFVPVFGAHIFVQSLVGTATMKHVAYTFGTADTFGGVFGVMQTVTDVMLVVGPLVFLSLHAVIGSAVFAVMAATGIVFALGFVVGPRAHAESQAVANGRPPA